jgi:hypothetical protein
METVSVNTENISSTDDTQDRDVSKEVIDDTSFEERVEMVGDILGTTLPTINKKSANFAMSVTKKAGKEYKRLPPSAMFEAKFDEFVGELSAAEGSHRAKSSKRKPCEVGKLPSRLKPKMQFYEIGDCPWLNEAPACQKRIYNKALYRSTSQPFPSVNMDKLKDWETMARENVSVLSHVDHFIAAGQRLFETLYDASEREEEMSPEFVWNMARQGICMMHSAGMGVQDLVRNNVWQIGEQMVTRRDAWLNKMEKLPAANVDQLRFATLNCPDLFEQDSIEEAIEAAADLKHDKVQDEMLSKITKMSGKTSEKTSKFQKQSFRQSYGRNSESSTNTPKVADKPKLGYQQQRGGYQNRGYSKENTRGKSFPKRKFSQPRK